MNILLTKSEHDLLTSILFKRMHALHDSVHATHGLALLLFGDEIAKTDALFEKLCGPLTSAICRKEWAKMAEIGAEAYSRDLTERGFE